MSHPSAPELLPLRSLPPGDALNHPYAALAERITEQLRAQQVDAKDAIVALDAISDHELTGELRTTFRRGSDDAIVLSFRARREGETWTLWLVDKEGERGPLEEGVLFRVARSGASVVPGFRGLEPHENEGPDARLAATRAAPPPPPSLKGRVKAMLRNLGPVTAALRVVQRLVERPDPPTDLTTSEGVTWRLDKFDPVARTVAVSCYDRGGIFDFQLNAEGVTYPPQVAGNYYADAYSLYAMAWLGIARGQQDWLDAARDAFDFLLRIYPQYAPAGMVWHHSDFKNPAILETVETLLKPSGNLDDGRAARWEALAKQWKEDAYNPTNVFALRYHGQAALLGSGRKTDRTRLDESLERLDRDQTAEGLMHDNAETYRDAHDLTYHQYSMACLAQGLAWFDTEEARRILIEGVKMSLALTTPDGEVAYVGRGANNIYHSASAILSFESAARLLETEEPDIAARMRRAAHLVLQRLLRFEKKDALFPTAMNERHEERVAWNHCSTPYNALSAAMLLKSAALATPERDADAMVPMEEPRSCTVAPDSGYAAASHGGLYAVFFAGCDKSYAWSDGRHHTGAAGLANIGVAGTGPLWPIADEAARQADAPMTDLPRIGGELPYGQGKLQPLPGGRPGWSWEHRYGGALCRRTYVVGPKGILVLTSVESESAVAVDGLVTACVRDDTGWSHEIPQPGAAIVRGPECALHVEIAAASPDVRKTDRASPAVTNPRGTARRIELARVPALIPGSVAWACHVVTVDGGRPEVSAGADEVTIEFHGEQLRWTPGTGAVE
ncbi:MAG: hypothetical protein ACYTGZ_11165 [Planctomycetota bacterium]|jgi:hypothetical protein